MNFFGNHIGEFAALMTAIFWTATSLFFESASNRIGSIPVNILRLLLGLLFVTLFTFIKRGIIFPSDANSDNWIWLSLSGLIGFAFGDLFLFKAYTIISSRFAMLIMNLVPPFTVLFGIFILGEHLTMFHYLGMTLTIVGIAIAIFSKDEKTEKISLKLSPKGIFFAFGGAIGQALGMVLSKKGMQDYDPFAATQIRIIAGIAGYILLITVMSRWKSVLQATGDRKGMMLTTVGAFFGPFLGVSFSLIAVKYTAAGIASTIMALVPVFLILPAIILYKHKVTFVEIAGTIISVAGVGLFFI